MNYRSSKILLFVAALSMIAAAAHAGTLVPPSNATVFTNIEDMSGWGSCTACAGGGANALYSMTQNISSPSLDGASTKFWIGGTTPFSHGLWWRKMSSNTSATNFILDMKFLMPKPGASQGLEFAANQAVNGAWYKFSTQCTFASGVWRVWDSKNGGWVSTGIACTRPPANTWQHVTFEYQRAGGKAVFVAITINGVRHYVNKSFYPQPTSSSASVGVHFQLDGNSTQSSYSVYVDQMKLIYW